MHTSGLDWFKMLQFVIIESYFPFVGIWSSNGGVGLRRGARESSWWEVQQKGKSKAEEVWQEGQRSV